MYLYIYILQYINFKTRKMKKVLLVLVSLTLGVIIYSCTDSNNVENQEMLTKNTYDFEKYQIKVGEMNKQFLTLNENLLNNKEFLLSLRSNLELNRGVHQYIDQETYNNFITITGVNPNLTLSEVNNLIYENIQAQEIGYLEYIDEANFSVKTKEFLSDIVITEGY